jgi:hypothetical protein
MLKLFVWEDVFADYTSGCAFAIAETKEQASELAGVGLWGWHPPLNHYPHSSVFELMSTDCKEHPLDRPFGFAIYGGG